MPEMSTTELKERLIRDLPGALAPSRPRTQPETNGQAAPAKPKKGEEAPAEIGRAHV